jgi:hypothetical protein
MAHQVTAQQLGRLACLYVRQSTLQQVLEHGESTARQYGLLGPPKLFCTLRG